MKVVHLITGLGKGGAETMLFQLLKHKTDNQTEHIVISMGQSHYYESKIRELEIELYEVAVKKYDKFFDENAGNYKKREAGCAVLLDVLWKLHRILHIKGTAY